MEVDGSKQLEEEWRKVEVTLKRSSVKDVE